MELAVAPRSEGDGDLVLSRGSLAALLVPERLEPEVATQIAVADGSLCGVRPRLGWKPGEEAAFSSDGLERLMSRQGLSQEVAVWKLREGQRIRGALRAEAQPAVVVEVTDADGAEIVIEAVRKWISWNPGTPVVVELPETTVVQRTAGLKLVEGLRYAGAEVAIHSPSGELAAVRALREVRPRYVRLDASAVLDEEVQATAFRMTALVAAAEGWPVTATGLSCREGVALARRCGVTIVEGHARRWGRAPVA